MTVKLPAPPNVYDLRDQTQLRILIEQEFARVESGPAGGGGGGSGGGGGYTDEEIDALLDDKQDAIERTTVNINVTSLPQGQTHHFTAPLIPVGICTRVTTSRPCRLRIYVNDTNRAADATRPPGVDPPAALVLLDVLTTPGALQLDLAPAAVLARTGTSYACALQALDAGTNNYSVTLTVVPLEI